MTKDTYFFMNPALSVVKASVHLRFMLRHIPLGYDEIAQNISRAQRRIDRVLPVTDKSVGGGTGRM